MKSWISSAFEDSNPRHQSSTSSSSVATQPLKKQPSQKLSTDKQFNKENQIPSSLPLSKSLRVAGTSRDNSERETRTLSEKYEPKSRGELVVNKNKVDQLCQILDDLSSKKKGGVLLIEGPSGCGKTVTLKILCREKSIDLVYWNSSSIKMEQFKTSSGTDHEPGHEYIESQQKQFKQFLFKSSRYLTDQIFMSESSSRCSKILFVKEIPSFAYYDPRSFRSILVEFKAYSKHPLVFSVSSSNNNGEQNPNKLFGQELRKELGLVEISFNAIAQTYLIKQLEKICQAESSLACIDKATIQSFCASSNGDLRHAVNMLELAKVGSDRSAIQVTTAGAVTKKGTRKRGTASVQSKEPKDKKILLEGSLKDPSYNLFRGVGKLLHRKPLEPTEDNQEIFQMEKSLPDHMKSYERVPMSISPEDVYNKLNITPELLVLYLYQNYIELFNLKSKNANMVDHQKQLDSLAAMSDSFIYSDLIGQRSMLVEPGSVQETRRREIASLIPIRSILFNFYFDEAQSSNSKTTSGGGGGVWMPLFKPFHYKLNDSKLERKKAAKSLIVSNSSQDPTIQRYLTHMNQDFFTNYMPFMSLRSQLTNKRSSATQQGGGATHQLLFNKCKPANSKLGLLKENDCDDDNRTNEIIDAANIEPISDTAAATAAIAKSNGFIYEAAKDFSIEECF